MNSTGGTLRRYRAAGAAEDRKARIFEAPRPLDTDRVPGAPSIHGDIGKDFPAHGEVFSKPDNAGLWRKTDAPNRFDNLQST